MALFKDKRIRTLIIVMGVLVSIGFLIAYKYYESVNKSIDPRAVPARVLYKSYNSLAQNNDFEGVFMLLDTIEEVYMNIPHYKESYEIGVLYNDRAAVYLTMAMYKDSIYINSAYYRRLTSDSLLSLAKTAVEKSISMYENWRNQFENLTYTDISQKILKDFNIGLEGYSEKEKEIYLNKRIEEIESAQVEIQRRLSVSYTNLGIIHRNLEDYEMAAAQYIKAIELWEDNLVAENNLNKLLGKPLKKQNFIRRLFPPSKK